MSNRIHFAMHLPSKILALVVCCSSMIARASIKNGDEIDVLTTKSGRVYEKVVVREILPDGLRIAHSSGAAKIAASELPQYQEVFSKILPAPQETSPEAHQAPPDAAPLWEAKSKADVADCSLFVKVSKGIDDDGSFAAWAGSAFLCNHGSTTYIYSNAHNFDGAIDFSIEDKNGNIFNDFVSVEVAANGQGLRRESGQGGDILRIRLRNFREKALAIDPEPVTKENSLGRQILVTGNTGGHGRITELEGLVTDISDDFIIIHNAATEQGNSGGPIVDAKTYRVIGILTWGGRLPEPLQIIWIKKAPELREGFKSGAGLATIRYANSSFSQLRQQKEVMNQLKKNVRLLGLLDTLTPTKQGLFVDRNIIVMGEYTVEDLLEESPTHPVVVELVRLDRLLSASAQSNIGINNQDMLKRYVASCSRCLEIISGMRRGIENSTNVTFFMRCELNRSRMLEIAKAYEALSRRCLLWYEAQRGTGGQALPLAKRFRLPEMRSGLEGLGLK